MGANYSCCSSKDKSTYDIDLDYECVNQITSNCQIPQKKDSILTFKTANDSSASPMNLSMISLISKHMKGYLFRKEYNKSLKESLINHTSQILSTYSNIIAINDRVIEAKYNQIYLAYTTEGWSEFYETKSNHDSHTPKYNTLLIQYNNNNIRDDIPLDLLSSNSKWLYKGEMNINGELNGYGLKIYRDGSIEEGTWVYSVFHGWNRSIDNDGIIHIGKYVNGKLNGKGIRVTVNNTVYKGNFVDDLRDGYGIETNDNSTYKGSYVKGNKCGKGAIMFSSGDSYEGDFSDNTFNGYGHYIWKNGKEYIGQYKNGKFHGEGYYKINDKESYKGSYVNGVKEGKGELTYADGRKYICSFVNGTPHGQGSFINKTGKKIAIEFDNGKLIKQKNVSNRSINQFDS